MNKKIIIAIIILLGISFLPFLYKNIINEELSPYEEVQVIDISENSILEVEGEEVYKAKLIGVDNVKKGELYYAVAHEFLVDNLKGKTVYIEKDILEKDNYGYFLVYVWFKKPSNISNEFVSRKLFNYMIIKEGLAKVSATPPNLKYINYLLEAERIAKEQERRIWR